MLIQLAAVGGGISQRIVVHVTVRKGKKDIEVRGVTGIAERRGEKRRGEERREEERRGEERR